MPKIPRHAKMFASAMVYDAYYPFPHKLLFNGSYTPPQLGWETNIQTETTLKLSVGMLMFPSYRVHRVIVTHRTFSPAWFLFSRMILFLSKFLGFRLMYIGPYKRTPQFVVVSFDLTLDFRG